MERQVRFESPILCEGRSPGNGWRPGPIDRSVGVGPCDQGTALVTWDESSYRARLFLAAITHCRAVTPSLVRP
jgi:hypothetical protein